MPAKKKAAPKRVAKKAVVRRAPVAAPVVLPNAADYAAYIDSSADAVSEDSLAVLRALAVELMDKERAVEDAKEVLSKAEQDLAVIQEKRLPEMLDQAGLPEFKFIDEASGATMTIKVGNDYYVSQPKDKEQRKKGYAWLISIGKKGIIKETVEVPVGRDASKLAKKIAAAVKKIDKTLDVGFSQKVESSTLRSTIIGWLESGQNVPEGLFNIHEKRSAKVSAG